MRTLLLDDEPYCLEYLAIQLKKYCPFLELVGQFTHWREAHRAVEQLRPDLVFLDLEMPEIDGFEFINQFDHPSFRVVFIASDDRYAQRAFRFNAIDYLLKPVDPRELEESVGRVRQIDDLMRKRQLEILLQLDSKRIALPMSRGGLHIQPISEILYCEADGSCCQVFRQTPHPYLHVSRLLKDVESILTERLNFFRLHNRFLVNLRHVTFYQESNGGEVTLTSGKRLPVARSRKKDLLELLVKT